MLQDLNLVEEMYQEYGVDARDKRMVVGPRRTVIELLATRSAETLSEGGFQ